MSAFLMSDLTLSRMAASIRSFLRREPKLLLMKQFSALGYNLETAQGEEKLAKAFFTLNAEAFASQFHEPIPTEFDYQLTWPTPNDCQLLKWVDCWLYQCAERNVPKHKLYRLMNEQLVRCLLRSIVLLLPAYDQAKWS